MNCVLGRLRTYRFHISYCRQESRGKCQKNRCRFSEQRGNERREARGGRAARDRGAGSQAGPEGVHAPDHGRPEEPRRNRWARLPSSVVQVVAVPALASPASPAAGRLTALSAGCGSPCGGPLGRTEAPRPGASPARQRECSHGRAGPRGLAPWENERQPPGKWLPNSRPTKQWENVYCCFKLLRFISFP